MTIVIAIIFTEFSGVMLCDSAQDSALTFTAVTLAGLYQIGFLLG